MNITDEQRKEAVEYFKERLGETDESFSISHKLGINARADSEYILSLEIRSRVLRSALSALEPKVVTRDWAVCLASVIQAESHYMDAADVLLRNLKTELGLTVKGE